MASLMTTFGGVSASPSSSKTASRRTSRSMTAMRSTRQFCACAAISASISGDPLDRAAHEAVGERAQRPRRLRRPVVRRPVGRRSPRAGRSGRSPTGRASAAPLPARVRVPRAIGAASSAACRRAAGGTAPPSRRAAAAASHPLLSRPLDRALLGLFPRVGRQHAERHRHAGVPRGLLDAVRDRREMYSKCGVAPRITQPRQTTASNRPVSAAPRGLRQLERAGDLEHLDVVSADAALRPAPRARRRAASSVMASLNRDDDDGEPEARRVRQRSNAADPMLARATSP